MSYNFYVSDQYRHLIQHQQQPQPSPIRNNPIVYHNNYQQYPNNNNMYQPPIAYLPGNQVRQQPQVNFRPNHDSWAAEQPNPRFSPNNLYPTLQPVKQTPSPTTPIDDTKQMIHKVQYGDTLQGLSLIYEVPISKIKQRNNIESDSIYYLKQVIIPNPKAQPLQGAKTQQFYIEEFMTYMPLSQKSQKVARYYLQESQWNVQAAVKSFKEDLQWEKKNKVQYKSIPVNQQQYKNNLNYSQQELLLKKYH